MGKPERQAAILEIVRGHRVGSQEALRELLLAEGHEATQATLSRDLKELRLAKMAGADGQSYYTFPDEWENAPALEALLPTLFVSSEASNNLIVVKTMTGGAQAVALGIDWEGWPEVMGTIGGDDTILLIVRDAKHVERVRRRLERIAGR